jgi:hemolysin activation/secretion protein
VPYKEIHLILERPYEGRDRVVFCGAGSRDQYVPPVRGATCWSKETLGGNQCWSRYCPQRDSIGGGFLFFYKKKARRIGLAILSVVYLNLAGIGFAQESGKNEPWLTPVVDAPQKDSPDNSGSEGNDASEKTLFVQKFDIVGNTLLTGEEINRVISSFEGRDLTLAEMKEVASRLTDLYRDKGYLLVRAIVPKQDFQGGPVEIKVLEGKVGKISVEGAKHFDSDWVEAHIDKAIVDGNFQADKFQRQLLLMNDYEDLNVQAVLSPGAEKGTADITVKVEDEQPLHVGFDYNNYGIPENGENRFGITLDVGNIATNGDKLRVRGVTQFPTDEFSYFAQARYSLPVNLNGTRVGLEYQRGAFASGDGLAQVLDIRGDANIASAFVSHALKRKLDHSSDLAFTVSYKDVQNNIFNNTPLAREDYVTTRLDYFGDWRDVKGRTLFQTSWTQGIGGDGGVVVSNIRADDNFAKFNFGAMRVQNLAPGFYGVLRGTAQLATDPLYTIEQFSVGGISTVRGYSQSELLGDNGYTISGELRWSPLKKNPEIFQVVTFIDHGGVRIIDRFPGELPVESLTGAGFGFRSSPTENTHLTLDFGFPISPSKNRFNNSMAVYGGVQTRF